MIRSSLVFEILAKVRFSVTAVLICIFCKMPRGAKRASASQSSVYQDTKNAIKRCMDPNASLSHVFPDYMHIEAKLGLLSILMMMR